ncbi:MAG: diguanylate cyclase [Candidatus Binatia bacterium]|nr:diguanylate cyclase [Candidatus Binatia bacterium]
MEIVETPSPRENPNSGFESERILIVDDDPVSAALASRFLTREGYACQIAQDGDEAWELLGPDVSLVLLDVMMPGKSGLEVLRRMRIDPILAGIPVLLATSVTDPAIQIRGLGLGAQGIVPKPINRKDLLVRVRKVTGRGLQFGEGCAPKDFDPLEADAGDLPVDLREIFGTASEESSEPTQQLTIRQLLAEREALNRRLDAGYRLLKAILRLHQMVGAGLAPDRVASGILDLAKTVLGAGQAVLWVPDGRQLSPLAVLNVAEPLPLPRDDASLPSRVTREWTTLEGDEVIHGERWFHFPLSVASEGVGVLSLRLSIHQPPSRTLSALYCAEAATALDASLRLRDAQSEALTDPLTGLLNRRGLEQQLDPLLGHARSVTGELSVLFVDLDHFKRVNDEFGHDRGDAILRLVAGTLRRLVRTIDVVARCGGDEFVVVLPSTDTPTAVKVADRIREGVSTVIRSDGAGTVPITVTIGVSSLSEGRGRASEVLNAADQAMLKGKTSGRNRTETLNDTQVQEEPRVRTSNAGTPSALRALLRTLGSRHPDSGSHSLAVGALSARLARRMGCARNEIREAGQAGLMHDIGKLYLPLEILDGTEPLTPAEREIVDQHTLTGAELVESLPETRHLTVLVKASQEHFDGQGYPEGLAGDEIPVAARIISVTDAYHAMITDRPYHKALAPVAIRTEFRRCAGTQFDPDVVEALLEMIS